MASRIQKPMLLVLFLPIFSVSTDASKTIGPIFIFGDSSVDVGTNNYLVNCTAKVNHPYYGIDYPGSIATGRYSNGLNPADTIVMLLGGYECSPPPFLALVNDSSNFTGDLLHGVNFASGGAGLIKGIGQGLYGDVISLEEQIEQFATVGGNITTLLGKSRSDDLLQGSMYIISIGSNDVMAYRYMHPMPRDQFIVNLTATYAVHLQNLYNLGARKFGISSIPPLGCCPIARSFSNTSACDDEPNDLAKDLYVSFDSLLQNLSSTLDGFKYSLGNTYNMTMSIINKPIGFKDVNTACCGNPTKGLSECKEGVFLCEKRDDYLFWDQFHPSQAASKLAAKALVFGEGPQFATPINFSTLRSA